MKKYLLILLLLFTSCVSVPTQTLSTPVDLAQHATHAASTQQAVYIWLTATPAEATRQAQVVGATATAQTGATQQSIAIQQTKNAMNTKATQQAFEFENASNLATATAQANAEQLARVRNADNATATALFVNSELMVFEQKAKIQRIELTNTINAFIPSLLGIGLALLFSWLTWRYGNAIVYQKATIRTSTGDPWTMILDGKAHNPDRSIMPVLDQNNLPPLEIQMAYLMQKWHEHCEKVKNDYGLEPLRAQPMKALPGGEQKKKVIHPHFGIDPTTLKKIPFFLLKSILMSGGSRSGKTNLAMYYLANTEIENLTVYDPKYRNGKWPSGATILTEPEELLNHVTERNKLFKERRDSQSVDFPQAITVIDEFTALVKLQRLSSGSVIKDALALIWSLVCYGAEFDVNMWILSQSNRAQALGLNGEGDLRNSLTQIDFPWHPKTKRESHIPRIAVVEEEKYLVPLFLEQRNVPKSVPDLENNPISGTSVPSKEYIAEHGKHFTEQEIATIFEMVKNGESANKACSVLGKRRQYVYEAFAAAKKELGE